MGASNTKEKPNNTRKKEADLSRISARVDRIKIDGLLRTYDDYIQKVGESLFKADNFQDLLVECNNARMYLNELGIFKEISVHIDVSKGESATPNGYEITFKGRELSRLIGSVGTEIGQNEGSLSTELSSPNIFGRGERLTLSGSYSNFKTTDINLKLSKNFYHTNYKLNRPEISLSLFRNTNKMQISGFKTHNYGILTDFSFNTSWPFDLIHSFQYETSIRELSCIKKSSPFFVRENCGPRMASLMRHILQYDQRDDSVFPTYGTHIKTTNEFCGLGGDIGFMMNNTHAEVNIPIYNKIAIQICSKFGIIQGDKKSAQVPLSNLFYLGGSSSLRGYEYGGAGPHRDGYTQGAHSYWSLGMHFWSPLPFNNNLGRFSNNFRTHLFYNFGNYNNFTTENMKSAWGIGIAYKFANRARIEFNYCVPINKKSTDRACKGFQFGIGYEFI